MVVGTVIHGAAFSKHFAAFSLAVPSSVKDKDKDKDATGPYSPSPSARARAATSTDTEDLAVDVVLAAKDGWGVSLLRELCEALSLPGATTASSSSSTVPSGEGEGEPADVMMTTTTEVEIVHATNEALQEEEEESGDENSGLTSISLAERPPRHPVVIPRRRRYCLHPTELRVRRRRRSTSYCSAPADEKKNKEGKGGGGEEVDDSCACASSSSSSSSWQTWRACPTSATAAAAAATPTASSSRDGKKNNVVNNKSHWHKIKKDNRASTFAALLVREIGLDRLRRGSGVVDVAGGSGELSFELAVRWGVPCTVIDPRGQGVVLTSRHKRLLASRAANASMITRRGRRRRSPQLAVGGEVSTPAPDREEMVRRVDDERPDDGGVNSRLLGCR